MPGLGQRPEADADVDILGDEVNSLRLKREIQAHRRVGSRETREERQEQSAPDAGRHTDGQPAVHRAVFGQVDLGRFEVPQENTGRFCAAKALRGNGYAPRTAASPRAALPAAGRLD